MRMPQPLPPGPPKNVTAPPPPPASAAAALAQLQTTLHALTTASGILQGFAHRNKNQHRGTRWWGPFGMLSRGVRNKLLPDLEAAVRRAEVLSSSSSLHKRRKAGSDPDGHGAGVRRRQPELDRFAERAQWVHDVAVPKAYEAFTQLTADKQFAQLGLVLIGVLAQVEHAIAPFVQDAAGEEPDAAASTKPVHVVKTSEVTPPAAAPSLGLNTGGDDIGVAISRDQFEIDQNPGPPIKQQANSQPTKRKRALLQEDPGHAGGENKDRNSKRTKASVEDLTSSDSRDKSKVKKKKKKGGDEFDDLFSSLL